MWSDKAAELLKKHKGNVCGVLKRIDRNDEGVYYEIRITLENAPGAFEEGDDQFGVWACWIEFGKTPARRAGGSAFVRAAREQDRIAAEVWERTR